jgi:alpha/beta superfamily hydrolase
VIIYGNRDSVTTAQDMERVIGRIRTQKNIKVDGRPIDGADHFFRGRDPGEDHLAEVEQHAREYLEMRLAQPPRPPTSKR